MNDHPISARLSNLRAKSRSFICAECKLRIRSIWVCALLIAFNTYAQDRQRSVTTIATREAKFDASGHLLPWISLRTAIEREMRFYEYAPTDHGYPIFVTTTFLDGDWKPIDARSDTIPATQNGLGIISYLKFYAWTHKRNPKTLVLARSMGDYLIAEDSTPDSGPYPRFIRSTGRRGAFPQAADSGAQSDLPFEIEPDKGAIAAYALLLLFDETQDRKYLDVALHHGRVLAANQMIGDALHSPWPFRVDVRSGESRGSVSSDSVFALRLYDQLISHGYEEFSTPRKSLWSWITQFQIPSAGNKGELFAQFFEDHDNPFNRNAWAPLNLARYLLEKRGQLDPHWREHSKTLIEFVRNNFTHRELGIRVCHEQDEDHDAWGGVNSTYAAVLALYAKSIGSKELADEARDALVFTSYSIDDRGRPRDLAKHTTLGGWQEDAHTDVVHNFVDALAAFPDWGR
jgi:hypothetical protein